MNSLPTRLFCFVDLVLKVHRCPGRVDIGEAQ